MLPKIIYKTYFGVCLISHITLQEIPYAFVILIHPNMPGELTHTPRLVRYFKLIETCLKFNWI